jgi:predicted kinase
MGLLRGRVLRCGLPRHDGRVVTIVVAGPQASGKTTLALALGRAAGVPVFSRDPLMAALLAGYPRPVRRWLRGMASRTGLRLQTALLTAQLEAGQSAVLECVAPPGARRAWRELTQAAGGRYLAVECVCSDAAVHEARLRARREAAGGRGISWRQARATMRRYQPDPRADFVADALVPVGDLVAAVVRLLADGAGYDGQGGATISGPPCPPDAAAAGPPGEEPS